MGLYVAMAKQYALATVHSHLLLLGWATMAIAGLVYFAAPDCATSRLARAHFWLHNAGLPVMMASLAVYEFGNAQAEILVGIGSMIVAVSLLLFTINLFRRCRLG